MGMGVEERDWVGRWLQNHRWRIGRQIWGGWLIPGTLMRVGVRPERLAPLAAKSIQSFFKNPFFKLFMQFWTQ